MKITEKQATYNTVSLRVVKYLCKDKRPTHPHLQEVSKGPSLKEGKSKGNKILEAKSLLKKVCNRM
jgi:hypothetical protein